MKSRFTPQVRGAIVQGVRGGLSIAEAAERAAVAPKTVAHWVSRGRAEAAGTAHADFASSVDAAREAAATAGMTEGEFRAHLAAAVRRGSVAALRLWWTVNQHDRDPPDDPDADDPFAVLDGPSRLDQLDADFNYREDDNHHE